MLSKLHIDFLGLCCIKGVRLQDMPTKHNETCLTYRLVNSLFMGPVISKRSNHCYVTSSGHFFGKNKKSVHQVLCSMLLLYDQNSWFTCSYWSA